jgi:hypothetical protein
VWNVHTKAGRERSLEDWVIEERGHEALIGEVKLMPQDLEVSIGYRLPEAIMNGLVAGVGFERTTFGL